MSRWKRAGLSLISAIAAELIIGISFSIPSQHHLFFEQIFGFVYFASILVIPGWLIALPIIVIPKRAQWLPTWELLVIGSLIGPGVMFAIGIYAAIANGTGLNYKREAWYLVGLALLVSFLTTAIYLTALKFLTRTQPPST
jgi:hypothetical protein